MAKVEFLNVGYIVKPRGLKGVVKVKSTTYYAEERYQKGQRLYLHNPETDERIEVYPSYYSTDGQFDYVSFEGLEDINLIEKYVRYEIQVSRNDIPPLPEGSYFFNDLIGLKCVDFDSRSVFGVVEEMVDFTAQVSFKIRLNNNKTIYIPFIDKVFVENVDLDKEEIEFHLLSGMLD